jgi:hypothetical protein
MKSFEIIPVLDRLLHLLCRSLPAYLADAKAWEGPGSEPIRLAVRNLAADQRLYAERVARAIAHYGGHPRPGSFSHEFTAKHDLSLSYLLLEILDCLDQDISWFEQCETELEPVSSLHALAAEILGNAKGHLDILGKLAGQLTESAATAQAE